MAFGPDGKLYVTTGDAGREVWAQDINSLAGKILRLNDDGSQPQDNPFGNLVYSWGHRNPQGLSWDEAGRLWATEHGPSGIGSGFDEINLIEKGGNYGWPDIKGDEEEEGMIRPIWHSGSRETWAPAGMEVMGDNIFFVGLRGETLYRGKMRGEEWEERKDYFEGDYGRLRIVKQSRDEQWLYLGTSNRDGRGRVREGDDKLIRVHRSYFEDL